MQFRRTGLATQWSPHFAFCNSTRWSTSVENQLDSIPLGVAIQATAVDSELSTNSLTRDRGAYEDGLILIASACFQAKNIMNKNDLMSSYEMFSLMVDDKMLASRSSVFFAKLFSFTNVV